jgi:hypothetical protein
MSLCDTNILGVVHYHCHHRIEEFRLDKWPQIIVTGAIEWKYAVYDIHTPLYGNADLSRWIYMKASLVISRTKHRY